MRELYIQSFDGTPIHCYLWDDVEKPKATAQISHGMAEHAGRYQEFAHILNAAGYIVFADDHRAHGRTESDKDRGRHPGDIYQKTLWDLVYFHKWLKREYSLPQVFMGHSYGSFLAQGFLQSGTDVRAVACCGTANMNGAQAMLALIWPLQLVAKDWRPKFVNKASDFIFDLQYRGDSGPSQWVTSDRERRKEFLEDPMAGIDVSVNFDWNMVKAFGRIYRKDNLARLNPDTAIGIFSGERDPVGGIRSNLARRLEHTYQKAGVRQLELYTYPGARHELHNEVCRDQYYQDITAFFDSVV